jgi:hemerythrin-like domain-containing protein
MQSRRDLIATAIATTLIAPFTAAAAEKEPEVTATEDLMREHGILRRALLVYAECVPRLREKPESVDASALHRTAELFRKFGERYHEQQLEEQHIFPVIRKMKRVASYADVLTSQHARGREITAYTLSVTGGAKISAGAPLASALAGLVRMYEHHAAAEDTIVFPAWKTNYTNKQLDEIGEKFEDIERKTFGHDGFEDAEKTMSEIERALGLFDLAQFTAPRPPA